MVFAAITIKCSTITATNWGTALMLHTYYQKLNKDMHEQIAAFTPQKNGPLARFKKSSSSSGEPQTSLGQWVRQRDEFCYVCRHFKEKYPRYIDTFLQLVTGNAEFSRISPKAKASVFTTSATL